MSKAARIRRNRKPKKKAHSRHSAEPQRWPILLWAALGTVIAATLAGGALLGGALASMSDPGSPAKNDPLAKFRPSEDTPDPSKQIKGIVIKEHGKDASHVNATERVAYDQSPPFGGPHDANWAACDGVVYSEPVRTENMVHALEHGAVWIAYYPDRLKPEDVKALESKVDGEAQLMMSPYPGLDSPISLQAWGHQLKLDSASDERVDQFITALKGNGHVAPEPDASCDELGPGKFDKDNPPPFDATPPGKDAKPMNYTGDARGGPM